MRWKIAALSVLVTLTISFTALAAPVSGAEVQAANVTASPGENGVAVPVDLTSSTGVSVSALSFDLSFDTGRLTFKQASVGDAAWRQASKSLVRS